MHFLHHRQQDGGASSSSSSSATTTTTTAQHNNNNAASSGDDGAEEEEPVPKARRAISQEELQFHHSPDDCWVSIRGVVYNFTDFLDEHPAGAESILKLGGTEGASAFFEVHNEGMLDDFEDSIMGYLESS
jgi:cytochrome b involved in lipid metabolism